MHSAELQQRAAMGGLFESESAFSINRPASAQGRFVNTSQAPARYNPGPPGFPQQDAQVDPAMMQALQTLTANGNFTPQQIMQIQMQLTQGNAQARPQSQNQWEKKPAANSVRPPPRPFSAAPSTSPQMRHGGLQPRPVDAGHESYIPGDPSRSALLEEFRNNKNRKYEVRVTSLNLLIVRISLEALSSLAATSTAPASSSKSSRLARTRISN